MRTTWILLLAVAACESTTDAQHIDFDSQKYTLQPGEEKYLCYTMNLPDDRDIVITKLTPTYGLGTHHILFSQAVAPEPEGVSECPVLARQTWVPLYAGGVQSGPLELPPQTGFVPFARGQQLILQLHLQNANDSPLTAQTSIRIDFADASPDIAPAGIFGMDNRSLDIPAHVEDAVNEMSCVVTEDLGVFAVLGHMHKHGVRLELSRGASAGEEMLYAEDWHFDTQPVELLDLDIKKGDNLFLRCAHENATDAALPYGESSDTEMCIIVLFHAPRASPEPCIKI
jgi:hypothetical protein